MARASTMRSLASSSPWARYADSIAISTCVPLAVFAIRECTESAFGRQMVDDPASSDASGRRIADLVVDIRPAVMHDSRVTDFPTERVKLMPEYSCDVPLWCDEGQQPSIRNNPRGRPLVDHEEATVVEVLGTKHESG
jgi:hypothetical protein